MIRWCGCLLRVGPRGSTGVRQTTAFGASFPLTVASAKSAIQPKRQLRAAQKSRTRGCPSARRSPPAGARWVSYSGFRHQARKPRRVAGGAAKISLGRGQLATIPLRRACVPRVPQKGTALGLKYRRQPTQPRMTRSAMPSGSDIAKSTRFYRWARAAHLLESAADWGRKQTLAATGAFALVHPLVSAQLGEDRAARAPLTKVFMPKTLHGKMILVSPKDCSAKGRGAMDIVAWLRGLGLGEYEPAIGDNRVDAAILPKLTRRGSSGDRHRPSGSVSKPALRPSQSLAADVHRAGGVTRCCWTTAAGSSSAPRPPGSRSSATFFRKCSTLHFPAGHVPEADDAIHKLADWVYRKLT